MKKGRVIQVERIVIKNTAQKVHAVTVNTIISIPT